MTTLAPSPLGLRRVVHQYVRLRYGANRWGKEADTSLVAYAYAYADGLVVVEFPPIPDSEDVGERETRYTITHTATGARVGEHTYLTMADAEAALGRVAGLFDWTLEGAAIRKAFDARVATDAEFTFRLTAALRPIRRTTTQEHT